MSAICINMTWPNVNCSSAVTPFKRKNKMSFDNLKHHNILTTFYNDIVTYLDEIYVYKKKTR